MTLDSPALERVLITGGAGALGSDLGELLYGSGEVSALPRERLDITDERAVERALAELRPRLVFNCAAFHAVDNCESEEARAFAVNAVAVKRLAERCAAADARLVHLSTNYVFDGRRPEPYGEDDLPAPQSAYAASKLAGEQLALAYAPGALVVRTAGLYGLRGSAVKGGNFVQRVLARARKEGRLTMVADQRLSPTFTADLAAALVEAVEAGAEGILHLTAGGDCSWLEFTNTMLQLAGLEVPVEPAETVPRPGLAPRPLNGVLARPRADAHGLRPLRPWPEGLRDYMERAGLMAA